MNEDKDGAPLGIALFLTADQLTGFGIDPVTTDIVEYWIENGRLQVRPDNM